MQHLKDSLGLQEISPISVPWTKGRWPGSRQIMSQKPAQVEELRVGENVKRRRRVAPAAGASRSRRRRSKLHRPPPPAPEEAPR